MKHALFFLILLWSAHIFADECASIWVYKAYNTCANPANGLDLTQPGTNLTQQKHWSKWLSGGRDQGDVCKDLRDHFNTDNLGGGLHAEVALTPTNEESENRVIMQKYRYQCELSVQKYPFKTAQNAACGSEDKYSYKIGGGGNGIPGQASCLSCENLNVAKPEALVDCLHQNIANVIEPKAVELRATDTQAVAKQVAKILNLNKHATIQNLQTTDQLQFFVDFLDKNPVNHDGSGGSGPIGTRPILQ